MADFDDVVVKPYRINEMLDQIERAVRDGPKVRTGEQPNGVIINGTGGGAECEGEGVIATPLGPRPGAAQRTLSGESSASAGSHCRPVVKSPDALQSESRRGSSVWAEIELGACGTVDGQAGVGDSGL